jgi:hypothetical protein
MKRRSMLALTVTMTLGGCTLGKQALRREFLTGQAVGPDGQMLQPRRCEFTIRTVKAPRGTPGIDGAVWQAADENAITDEDARRALEANGLRLGVITGALPPELEKILEAPPPNEVDTVQVVRGEGEGALIRLTPEPEGTTQTSLLLNRQGRVGGKGYEDLRGHVRISGTHDGADAVVLRMLPELHHGPMQRRFAADATAGAFAPQQLMMKDGQEEEALHDLAASVVLRPGQVAVLGCATGLPSSLGEVLMTEPAAKGAVPQQKLVLITARRETTALQANTPRPRRRGGTPAPPGLQAVEPDVDKGR